MFVDALAYVRQGKGQDHPAKPNPGDRFAYACARRNDPPLHVVGNDLPQAGIPSATGCPVSASR